MGLWLPRAWTGPRDVSLLCAVGLHRFCTGSHGSCLCRCRHGEAGD